MKASRAAEGLSTVASGAGVGAKRYAIEETALEAARTRLRMLPERRSNFRVSGEGQYQSRDSDCPPIAAVPQRKIGPGQYVNAGASDQFVVGDLTVWLTAFVRETEAPAIGLVGKCVQRSCVWADFNARINYVSAAIDPSAG